MDQLPAWAFVAAAALLFAAARAGRLFALVHQSRGGMELGSILMLGAFLGVLIFAVRRRQSSAWEATMHLLGSLVAGNALALLLVWPFIPDSYALALVPMLRATMVSGATMTLVSLPVAIALLWLSRRYGSHSALTERRYRVVREMMRRRLGLAQPEDAGAG